MLSGYSNEVGKLPSETVKLDKLNGTPVTATFEVRIFQHYMYGCVRLVLL